MPCKSPKTVMNRMMDGKQNGTGENLMLDAVLGRKCKTNTDECELDGNRQEKMQQQKRRMRKKWTCTDERGRKNRDRKLVITLEEPEETKKNRVPE